MAAWLRYFGFDLDGSLGFPRRAPSRIGFARAGALGMTTAVKLLQGFQDHDPELGPWLRAIAINMLIP